LTSRLPLGVLTHGSLLDGVEMKLDAGRSVEDVSAGTFVVVEGETHDFFCLITDARIEAANEQILLYPPPASEPLLRRVMQGASTYATVQLKPLLMVGKSKVDDAAPRAVKTVPAHFSPVFRADQDDISRVFGSEANGTQHFAIGSPLDMDGVDVCIDLERFAERSSAVFGRTGTGKTFVTRLLLAGLLRHDKASFLVFDAHGEYGWRGTDEGTSGGTTWGLGRLFPGKVFTATLDPAHSRKAGTRADLDIALYADQFEPSDILPLRSSLNLTDTAADSAALLFRHYKERWLEKLMTAEPGDLKILAEETGANEGSLSALWRRLERLKRYDFFRLEPSKGKRDALRDIEEAIASGKSVVFEFGGVQDETAYLLVSGLFTRRLRDLWEDKAVKAQSGEGEKPRQLVIVIEEAHRFLAPGIAHETPFGKIAREMRKFYVSLLVVDQRPSAIADEVMSQIGTKFVAALSDDKDLSAALVGTSGASSLRGILATLETKQQMLVLGHAVPMPIAVRTRAYDQAFFDAVRPISKSAAQHADDIFGD